MLKNRHNRKVFTKCLIFHKKFNKTSKNNGKKFKKYLDKCWTIIYNLVESKDPAPLCTTAFHYPEICCYADRESFCASAEIWLRFDGTRFLRRKGITFLSSEPLGSLLFCFFGLFAANVECEKQEPHQKRKERTWDSPGNGMDMVCQIQYRVTERNSGKIHKYLQ